MNTKFFGDSVRNSFSNHIILFNILLTLLGCAFESKPEKFPLVLHSIPMTGITQGSADATGTGIISLPSHFAAADITIPTATAADPFEVAICIQSGRFEDCSGIFVINSATQTRVIVDFTQEMVTEIRTTGMVSLYIIDFATRRTILSGDITRGVAASEIPVDFSEPAQPTP